VVQSPKGALIRIGEQSAFDFESPTGEDVPMQQAISVKNAGFAQNVMFYRDGGLMTVHADGSVTFGARWLRAWELFRLVPEHHLDSERYWLPSAGKGGTSLMLERLRGALGEQTKRINLRVDSPSSLEADPRPLVVWIHNKPELSMYQWCRDPEQVARVARFVFVSQWQRQKFIEVFGLPAERCDVIRNAIETDAATRQWPEHSKWRWRCAYISAPFRGLNILLDAWQELSPINAELHIWSGVSLWGFDDSGYRPLFARAMEIPNVIYHRIAPNATIRAALLDMHFLVYPCTTDDETFCLSMVEAMSAGCRVIAPARAALPETAAGFARMYPSIPDQLQHKRALVHALADELAHPWGGRLDMAEAQQAYCRVTYDWIGRVGEWRRLIDSLSG
jgi:glycosyltransferase involved in cell wall biosynthesis